MSIGKYLSIVPVFAFIFSIGYGDIAWYFKIVIWAVFYFIVKFFGVWLVNVIFGFGRGGAITSIIILIVGIVTLTIAFVL